MDPRERFDDPTGAAEVPSEYALSSTWTAMPGIVSSYNPATQTVTVNVSVRSRVQKPDGSYVFEQIPPLQDVPVCFPQGGGFVMTFPIAAGDECLVVFAARCIDSWWQSGGVQDQAVQRIHSLSDGFAIVGPRSKPRALSGVSSSAVQLRSSDGSIGMVLDPGTGRMTLTAPGGVYINGIRMDTHRHGGVQAGGSNTGVPIP